VGKHERKRPLGRSMVRRKNNVATDLKEVGCENLDRIRLVQDRVRWR
jgi:hypothetical protein